MGARGAIVAIGVLGALSLVVPAAAAPGGATGVALQTFEEGRKLYEQGRFAEALRSFQASLAVQASPNTRLYVARCYLGLGKVASAHAAFRLASREAEDRVSSTGDRRYAATQASAGREADELAPRVPRVSLSFRTETGVSAEALVPEGTTLVVDGDALPRVAWSKDLELDPGAHVVALSGPKLAPFRGELTLAEGQRHKLAVLVKRIAMGSMLVRFSARPIGMAATLDDEALDLSAKDERREVAAGRHRLVVSAPGYQGFAWEGQVADGASIEVPVALKLAGNASQVPREGDRGTPMWLFFASAGLAGAAAGTAAVLLLDASQRDKREQQLPVAERSETARTDIQREATVASVLFAVGGTAALGAGVLAFTTRWGTGSSAKEPRAARGTPSVRLTPRLAGLGLEGSF